MESQKITRESKRRYDDACGTAHGLELIGERWALLVLRELMLGPKRFSDLKGDLPGISANVLTQRLEGLEASRLLKKRRLPPPAAAQVYELTPWGYEAEPIVQTLGRWAARSPAHDPTLPISASSIILSFRTMFDAAQAKGFRARIALRIREEIFVAEVDGNRFTIDRGEADGADAVLTAEPATLAAIVYGGLPLDKAIASGMLDLEGSRAVAERFTKLFVLPPKAY